ncbi:MAG: hypothetical protein ABIJ09_02455 [Pseudomonadota bacterium]
MDTLPAARLRRLAILLLLMGFGLLPVATRAAEPPAKTKLAIMNLRGVKGVDEDLTQVVAQYLATKINATERYSVITRDDVKSMLQHEQLKMEVGCDEEASCLAELGGALGVDLMVSGTLAVMGTDVLVNLVVIDVRKATVVRREAEKIALKDSSLDEACLKAVDQMLPRLLPDVARVAAKGSGRLWTFVAAGVSVLALAAGAGSMWFGDHQLSTAEDMASGSAAVDYAEFNDYYTQGQVGWYGGMAILGVGVAAAAGTVGLYFIEGSGGEM